MDDEEFRSHVNGLAIHKKLQSPHIIRQFEIHETDETTQVLLELAENGAFRNYISQSARMPESLALKFCYQIAKGLEYLHSQGIVHRNINPENIVFDSEFRPKIIDFTQSKKLNSGERRKSVFGMFEYMAPEVANQDGYNSKCDVWSLGCLMYEIFEGKVIREAAIWRS